jgi:hypothetical protein
VTVLTFAFAIRSNHSFGECTCPASSAAQVHGKWELWNRRGSVGCGEFPILVS